ncbi:MAG: helix-turn-helix domain-containing protein, partial [Waterburya sp.]
MSNFFLSPQTSSNKSLGELIKKIRTTNNLTQTDFGKQFEPSVTQSTVARWENGIQTPDRTHFPKI